MNVLEAKTNEIMCLFTAKIKVERHVLSPNNAMHTSQCDFHLLIHSVVHPQEGVLQPQIIFPVTLMENLIKNVSDFRKQTTLPTPTSKNSVQFFVSLCEL